MSRIRLLLIAVSWLKGSFGRRVVAELHLRDCGVQIQAVLAQVQDVRDALSAIQNRCGSGSSCLSDKSENGVLDDAADAENAQALMASTELLQIKMRAVEACGPTHGAGGEADDLGKVLKPQLAEIRTMMEALAARKPEVAQVVAATRNELAEAIIPLKVAELADTEVPPDTEVPDLDAARAEFDSAELVREASSPYQLDDFVEAKLYDAVRRMWCMRGKDEKKCKSRRGGTQRSCYRVLLSGKPFGKSLNPLDKVNPIPMENLHLDNPASPVKSQDDEWGVCLNRYPDVSVAKTVEHFAQRQDLYNKWEYGRVKRMWCMTPDNRCRQKRGAAHQSCYRVVQQDGSPVLSDVNVFDRRNGGLVNGLQLRLQRTNHGEWGLCLDERRDVAQESFRARLAEYNAWLNPAESHLRSLYDESLYEPGSSLVEVHNSSSSIAVLESGHPLAIMANVVSTITYGAFAALAWVIDGVGCFVLNVWMLGLQILTLGSESQLAERFRWLFMQPMCIAYKAAIFIPDLVKSISAGVMRWATRELHSGFADLLPFRDEWYQADKNARSCFSKFPGSQYGKVYRMPTSAVDREQESRDRQALQDALWRDSHSCNSRVEDCGEKFHK